MTDGTRKLMNAAVSALKSDGYSALLLLFDKQNPGLEVLCSETNDPQLLAAMAKDALLEIANPIQEKVN